MKTVMIKSTLAGESLAHPGANPGHTPTAIIYAIAKVPAEVTNAQVLHQWTRTGAPISLSGGYTFFWTDVVAGKLLTGKAG